MITLFWINGHYPQQIKLKEFIQVLPIRAHLENQGTHNIMHVKFIVLICIKTFRF